MDLVRGHLERSGRPARVSHEAGSVRVRWEPEEAPSVTIVIPTRSRETLLARCLDCLAGTEYEGFELV